MKHETHTFAVRAIFFIIHVYNNTDVVDIASIKDCREFLRKRVLIQDVAMFDMYERQSRRVNNVTTERGWRRHVIVHYTSLVSRDTYIATCRSLHQA